MNTELTTRPPDDQEIVEFLLGASSAEQSERIDELSVTDDEFARRVQAIEYDLVDSYAKGDLPSQQLARFNSHYLASPKRRERLRMSEAFVEMVDKLANSSPGIPISSGRRGRGFMGNISGFFSIGHPALQWGLAAGLLVVLLTAGYLLFENQALRNEAERVGSERAALEQRERELERRLDEERSGDAETEKELAQLRERLAQLERQVIARNGASSSTGEARVISLSLSPQSRGIGQIPALVLLPGSDFVALTLNLEAAGFPMYRAVLKDPGTGRVIWRSGQIRSSGNGNTVRVNFRASVLNAQNYVLELSGISSRGAENVGSYVFRAAKN